MEVYLDALKELIFAEEQPLRTSKLTERAVRSWLERNRSQRKYAPGSSYETGERILYEGQVALVESVTIGENSIQGTFQVLALAISEDHPTFVAANIKGAPNDDRHDLSDDEVQRLLQEDGAKIRRLVESALEHDEEFIWVPDSQGGLWCLKDLMIGVNDEDVRQVERMLSEFEKLDADLQPVSIEALVERIWGSSNDGSALYRLCAFSLEATLQRYQEFEHIPGDGWLLSSRWARFQDRPALISPKQPNVVPPATVTGIQDELEDSEPADNGEEKGIIPSDFTEWLENRQLNAQFTLSASHYYRAWLPLTKDLRRVFPPLRKLITFYHRFGGDEQSFVAVIDPESGRILGSEHLYNAFYNHGIYPGAKLVVSHRGNLDHYDIRVKPVKTAEIIRVRRLEIDEQGQLVDWVEEEPQRYEVDKYVFVAGVRWEDIPALFMQADEVGKGVFQLMYERCSEWVDDRGSPLYISAEELYNAIHFDAKNGRLTIKATIDWELWKRLAFNNQGDGRYQFRPEYGSRTVLDTPSTRRRKQPAPSIRTSRIKKDRRLKSTYDYSATNWSIDEEALAAAVADYIADPLRPKILFLRGVAHEQIRRLIAEDRIGELSLATFNEQIWQIGYITYNGVIASAYSEEAIHILESMTIDELQAAYDEGRLEVTGNQTWGSATRIYGPHLKVSIEEKEVIMRTTLKDLLYGADNIESRLSRVLDEANGFGINVASGILHVNYPDLHILYNAQSVLALKRLGVNWSRDWRRNVSTYGNYKQWCFDLLNKFNFVNTTDVDWFIYTLANSISEGKSTSTSYLLGLAAVRGAFWDNAFKIHLEFSTLEAQVSGLDNTALESSYELLARRLENEFGNTVEVEIDDKSATISIKTECKIYDTIHDFIDPSGSMRIPEYIFDMSRDEKIEFARGIADAAGYVRRAQYYMDGRIFIFFQLRQSDWLLPTSVCRLFQLELGIPVSFIVWGHPNIRDPKGKAKAHSWAKEHQLKVFCDAFEEIGFFLPYKQRAFEELANINRGLRKPLPALCHPNNKKQPQAKGWHPEEKSVRLPIQLRGVHFDSWWQICLKMGCPFAKEHISQGSFLDDLASSMT